MVRSLIVVWVGAASLLFAPAAPAQCCGGKAAQASPEKSGEASETEVETSFLPAYFRIWKALGKDELKGVPEAKKELVSNLETAAQNPPKGLSGKDRAQRAKLLDSARTAASKLDASDLKKAREGFGALSGDLRKFVEAFPAETDVYVVHCDMAKKSWLQDAPEILNPYYGSSMSECGKVVRRATGKAYTCPMHTTHIADRAGECPTCHMKLVPVVATKEEPDVESGEHGNGSGHPED